MAQGKIRVHNRGKRDYTLPPAPNKKGAKNRMLPAGRAIEVERKLGLKLIEDYPADLVNFEDLVSDDSKDLQKENTRLESENSTYKEKIEQQSAEIEKLKENADPDVQALKDRIAELEAEKENADPDAKVEGGFQSKEVIRLEAENKVLGTRVVDLEVFIENSGLEVPPAKPSEGDETPPEDQEPEQGENQEENDQSGG